MESLNGTVGVEVSFTFCAGHRLLKHPGKCAKLHGHNYQVDVEVTYPMAVHHTSCLAGYMLDFTDLKALVKGWVDKHWDHGFILEAGDPAAIHLEAWGEKLYVLPFAPSAENLARYLTDMVSSSGVCPQWCSVRVRVCESGTAGAWVEVLPGG